MSTNVAYGRSITGWVAATLRQLTLLSSRAKLELGPLALSTLWQVTDGLITGGEVDPQGFI